MKGIGLEKWTLKAISMLLFVLLPSLALAVELSEIRVYSLLNEPLNAEITLSKIQNISIQETLVSVAERDYYVESGLEPLPWIYKIKFHIIKNPDSGKTVIKMTTTDPVKDPYVDLFIVVTWPGGKIVREYTLLLDPPKIAVPSVREATVKPLKTKSTVKKTAVSTTSSTQLISELDVPTVPGMVASKVQERAAARRLERAQSRVIRPGGLYGPVCDETLWSIAKRLVENSPFSVYQGVAAIAHKNPSSFRYGNINSLAEGAVLNLPSPQELGSLTKQEAQYFVEAQNQDWQQGHFRTAPAELPPQQYPEKIVEHRSSKALRLVAPEPETPLNAQSSKRSTMVDEEIDTLKRSNEDASQKNEYLKNQNEVLSTQLSAKDQEIQQLRAAIQKGQPLPNTTHTEEFAVAVPDIKKPTPSGFPEAEPANMDLHASPAPAPKVMPQVAPQVAPKEIKPVPSTSLEPAMKPVEAAPTQSRVSFIKKILLWLLVLFTVLFTLSLVFWAGRKQFLEVFDKWIEKYAPSLKRQTEALAPVEMPFLATPREHLHFDLEKALTALSQEEKRYLNIQSTKESAPKNDVSLEDVDVYVAYERYAQAEKILQTILTKNPEYWEALLKLLELYVLTEDYQDFEKWYATVPADLNEQAPRVWSRIELLKSKVENEKSIKLGDSQPLAREPEKEAPVSNFDLSKKYSLSLEDTDLPSKFQERSSELYDLLPEVSSEPNEQSQPATPVEPVVEEPDEDIQSHITLAKAYIDIGDYDSAREFLMKALTSGTPAQKQQVQELLDRISKNQ